MVTLFSDLFYCIEFENKIITSGRTDSSGFVKRTDKTKSKEDYIYYWGDEALLKIEK